MIEPRRRAYLEAMGFDVWIARPPVAERRHLGVGAGRGSTLLVCPAVADCRTDLAGDVVRALGGDPVWAWLDPATDEDSQLLEGVISDRLITRVLLFGPEPGRCLFQGPIPEFLGAATITVVPRMQELAVSSIARQSLWQQLRAECMAERTGAGG